jgi:hypothetical protein
MSVIGLRLSTATPLRPFRCAPAEATCQPSASAGCSAVVSCSSSARVSCRHTTSAVVPASHGSNPRLVSERCLMAARMPLTLMVLTITLADTSGADQRTERARTAEIGPIFRNGRTLGETGELAIPAVPPLVSAA